MATQVAAKIISIIAATYHGGGAGGAGGACDGLQVRVATSGVRAYDARRKPDGKWRVEWGLDFIKFYLVSVCLLLPLYVT